MPAYIIIILLAALAVIAVLIVKFTNFFHQSGLGEIISLAKEADISSQLTPRSVSGGDTIFLPLIKKEFPEFNSDFLKSEAENTIKNIFEPDCKDIPEKVSSFAELVRNKYINEVASAVKIHRTAISNYVKAQGTATVSLQTAFEFQSKGNKGDFVTHQEKYETEFTYYFTGEALDDNEGVSLRCGYCGAPVTTSGVKVCEYCGNFVEVILGKSWQLTSINIK